MLDDVDVVYTERVQSGLALTLDRRTGSRTGAYGAALGHAMLAYLPEHKSEDIIRRSHRVKLSERTLTDVDELLNRLALVRQRGFAVSDGENAYGLRTVAAAVLDADGHPVAGVSATINASRMPLDEFIRVVAPEMCRIAAELGRAVDLSFGAVAQAAG
jgi:IclR family pca regulon transcriptional regulator